MKIGYDFISEHFTSKLVGIHMERDFHHIYIISDIFIFDKNTISLRLNESFLN